MTLRYTGTDERFTGKVARVFMLDGNEPWPFMGPEEQLLAEFDHVPGHRFGPFFMFEFKPLDPSELWPVVAVKQSSRDPSVTYNIRRSQEGAYSCECEGWKYRSKCRHMREYLDELQAQDNDAIPF